MEFQFPPFLRRERRQTLQAQPSLVTSTGRESVRLHSSICIPAPTVGSRSHCSRWSAGVQLEPGYFKKLRQMQAKQLNERRSSYTGGKQRRLTCTTFADFS